MGGFTFVVGGGASRCLVKWCPHASGIDLSREIARLQWVAAFVSVPRVIDQDRDQVASWFASAAIAGENAISPRW